MFRKLKYEMYSPINFRRFPLLLMVHIWIASSCLVLLLICAGHSRLQSPVKQFASHLTSSLSSLALLVNFRRNWTMYMLLFRQLDGCIRMGDRSRIARLNQRHRLFAFVGSLFVCIPILIRSFDAPTRSNAFFVRFGPGFFFIELFLLLQVRIWLLLNILSFLQLYERLYVYISGIHRLVLERPRPPITVGLCVNSFTGRVAFNQGHLFADHFEPISSTADLHRCTHNQPDALPVHDLEQAAGPMLRNLPFVSQLALEQLRCRRMQFSWFKSSCENCCSLIPFVVYALLFFDATTSFLLHSSAPLLWRPMLPMLIHCVFLLIIASYITCNADRFMCRERRVNRLLQRRLLDFRPDCIDRREKRRNFHMALGFDFAPELTAFGFFCLNRAALLSLLNGIVTFSVMLYTLMQSGNIQATSN